VTSHVWPSGGRHLWPSGEASDVQSHARGHLVYAASGVLAVHTERGTSIVPANRVAWTPAGFTHYHRAHGDTDMRIVFLAPSLARLIPDHPAVFLPGRRALGFRNTWGARAGACRNTLGCVFRGVELGVLPGFLQPVDLHLFKHDLRMGHAILADSDCRADEDWLFYSVSELLHSGCAAVRSLRNAAVAPMDAGGVQRPRCARSGRR